MLQVQVFWGHFLRKKMMKFKLFEGWYLLKKHKKQENFCKLSCFLFFLVLYSFSGAVQSGKFCYPNAGRNVFPALFSFFGAFLSGKIVFPCSRVLLCPNSPCLSMVLICGQNFCCGQYVVVMWSAMPSDFCSHCESGGVCIVALVKTNVKRFRG